MKSLVRALPALAGSAFADAQGHATSTGALGVAREGRALSNFGRSMKLSAENESGRT